MSEPRSLGNYLSELEGIRRRLDSFLEHAMVATDYGRVESPAPGTWSPAVDLYESTDHYLLFAEVPGVERQDIELEVRGRKLILAGRRAAPENEHGQAHFQRMERSHGPFRRVFHLDQKVRAEEIEAKLERGVLAIRLPKSSGGARRVEVDVADGSGGSVDVD